MSYTVVITDDAADDMSQIYGYINANDVLGKADYVLNEIEAQINRLSELPQRGTCVKELQALGITEFREVYFTVYRIIYRVIDQQVVILLISDGRRSMQQLLERRVLGA